MEWDRRMTYPKKTKSNANNTQFIMILLALHFLFLNSCDRAIYARTEVRKDDSLFRIKKIDSINNYYLIYAKKGDSLYKIVSEKVRQQNCQRIKENGVYKLLLSSIWRENILIGNVNVSPSLTPHVNCLSFNDSTSKLCKR